MATLRHLICLAKNINLHSKISMTICVTASLPNSPTQAAVSAGSQLEATAAQGIFAGLLLNQIQLGQSGLAGNTPQPPLHTSASAENSESPQEDEVISNGIVDPSVLALLAGANPQVPSVQIITTGSIAIETGRPSLGAPSTLVNVPFAEQDPQALSVSNTNLPFASEALIREQWATESAADFAASPQAPGLSATHLNQAPPETQTSSPSKPSSLPTPLHSEQWPAQFGEKLIWLAKSDVQTAQISINPPQLGPIQINLTLNGDQATAVFASPHAEVRNAIENAMPQLKEMLSSAGISLGQSDVGSNLPQQQGFANDPHAANSTKSTSENAILPGNDSIGNTSPSSLARQGDGLVDLFA